MKLRTTPHLQGGIVCEKIYTFIIYPDSDSYNYQSVLEVLKSYPEYIYIVHNKESVKSHTHCIVRFPSVKSINALADELGISVNIIKWRNSFSGAVQYLTHENRKCAKDVKDKKKFIYPRSELISNLDSDYIDALFTPTKEEKEQDELDKVLQVLDFIESGTCKNTRELIRYAASIGAWSTLRRGGLWFRDSFQEVLNEKRVDEYRKIYRGEVVDGFSRIDNDSVEF